MASSTFDDMVGQSGAYIERTISNLKQSCHRLQVLVGQENECRKKGVIKGRLTVKPNSDHVRM